MFNKTAIVLQIMELIAEKKGRDTSILDAIRKDLDSMKDSRDASKRMRTS